MKKILKLILIAFVVLGASCSKSEDNNTPNLNVSIVGGKHFPKKIIRINRGNKKDVETYEITNGKIMKVTYEFFENDVLTRKSSLIYEYEGDLLKRKRNGDGSLYEEYTYTNGKLTKLYAIDKGTTNYEYDNKGRLSKLTHISRFNNESQMNFEYLSDTKIKVISNGNSRTETYIETFVDGNLLREEGKDNIVYEYDNKNNPFHNDFQKVILPEYFLEAEYSKNNIKKIIDNRENIYTIEYNTSDYPTKIIAGDSVDIYEY